MSSAAFHIAQLNVARALMPLEDPLLADFMAQLDSVNALAEESPGFVWRLQGDSGNATDMPAGDDPQVIVNLSTWESAELLFDFVYKTAHTKVMARRREWFEKPATAHMVLWWVPAGHEPGVEEALARLALLDSRGPTADAFTFKVPFPSPLAA